MTNAAQLANRLEHCLTNWRLAAAGDPANRCGAALLLETCVLQLLFPPTNAQLFRMVNDFRSSLADPDIKTSASVEAAKVTTIVAIADLLDDHNTIVDLINPYSVHLMDVRYCYATRAIRRACLRLGKHSALTQIPDVALLILLQLRVDTVAGILRLDSVTWRHATSESVIASAIAPILGQIIMQHDCKMESFQSLRDVLCLAPESLSNPIVHILRTLLPAEHGMQEWLMLI